MFGPFIVYQFHWLVGRPEDRLRLDVLRDPMVIGEFGHNYISDRPERIDWIPHDSP